MRKRRISRAIADRRCICIGISRMFCLCFFNLVTECKEICSSWGSDNTLIVGMSLLHLPLKQSVLAAGYWTKCSVESHIQSMRVYMLLVFVPYTLLLYLKSIWKCCYLNNDTSGENENREKKSIKIWSVIRLDVKINVSCVCYCV